MTATRALKRLLTIDREELQFRASTAVRREAERFAYMTRRPRWRREMLVDALRDDEPLIRPAVACLKAGDWMGAHGGLMHHMATRRPRFVLDPAWRTERATVILDSFPGARQDAVRRGDRVASDCFDLLGYRGVTFPDGHHPPHIDWHLDPVHGRHAPRLFWSRVPYLEPLCGDHKIVWELNRHQSWMSLGRAYWLSNDERYRDAFVEQFDSWMHSNPPLSGINWASMLELGLRSLSWLWALHFFVVDRRAAATERSPWTVDLLLGLDRQLTLVGQNLSRYFSPNTHLLGEALALYVAGRVVPELRRAAGWERLGRAVLIEQIPRQINADGGHAELSTHYHRYTLDFYLLALAVARQTADPHASSFAAAAANLARFARTISSDNGRLPAIGDDDGGSLFPICGRDPSDVGDSLQLAAQLLDQPALAVGSPAEEVAWLTGAVPTGRIVGPWLSAALPETGYFVSRSERGDHLTVDAGRHGFLNGGHAHADALAVTLSVRGLPFLIDPGTGCYTIDPVIRDRFRSTRYHNTLTIDGRSQSIPDGPFHWRSAARGTALEWRTERGFDLFEGSHDGYTPSIHHRTVLARPGFWVIVDRLLGTGLHQADAHWHLDPSWDVTRVGLRTVRAQHPDGATVWILALRDEIELLHGSNDSDLGWCAPIYGSILPTSAVRMSRRAKAPFDLVTVVVETRDEPEVEPLMVGRVTEDGGEAIGFTVDTPAWRETVLFTRWTGESTVHPAIWTAAGLRTDARVVCWREVEGEEPHATVLIDGTVIETPASGVPMPRTAREQQRMTG